MPQLETVNYSSLIIWVHFCWFFCYGFSLVYLFYPITAILKIRYKFVWKVLATLQLFFSK